MRQHKKGDRQANQIGCDKIMWMYAGQDGKATSSESQGGSFRKVQTEEGASQWISASFTCASSRFSALPLSGSNTKKQS
jgi:hypothetical protein